MEKKVGIVLVNYNSKKYIADCINSLLEQTYENIKILFWDNHSKDGSVEIVKKKYPQVYVVESQYNYGFAQANNMAVKKLLKMGMDYVLLLNIDTKVDSLLVERLLEKADNNTVTTAHIRMGRREEAIWYAGGELKFNEGRSVHCCIKDYKGPKQVTFISGCCMMIHRDIICKYGLFDINYYMYFEDTDLCMRWYLNGVRMYYIPTAKMWHKVGGSSGGSRSSLKEYYMVRNRLYFVHKYRKYLKTGTFRVLFEIIKNDIIFPPDYDYGLIRFSCWGIIDYYRKKMSDSYKVKGT